MPDISSKKDLIECKKDLLDDLELASLSEEYSAFTEENFINIITELLSDAGIYEDIEIKQYRHDRRGIKLDGYNWNPLEKILSIFVIKFSNIDELVTINQSQIEKLGKQASKFIESMHNQTFLDSLAATDTAREIIEAISPYLEETLKFRVVIVTDHLMSERVKLNKLKINDINKKESFFEIWDLQRICNLRSSDSEGESFSIDFKEICGGLKALPADLDEKNIKSFLCVMPAGTLRVLYDQYGQRLLESNVRTFLQFRGKVNSGMRETLFKNPENFFAYNNGLTVTATGFKTEKKSGALLITNLDNMQIVNGGQTTSAIYFTPLEKTTQKGIDFSKVDLSKVFVQMKLTVIDDLEKAEEIKENVARYANTQNTIQTADLVSNHPLHRKLEKLSRDTFVPPGEKGVQSKWFYERARGQYDTKLRALKSAGAKRKFLLENPKNQKFSKTDMAKFENTWRMRPYEVKKGAQKNLELLGVKLLQEWENDPNNFEIVFYKDLIAKAILFKSSDRAIQYESEWYKLSSGYKAETVTYTLSILRHNLNEQGLEINLKRIYDAQKISDSLKKQIINLAKEVRDTLLDEKFRKGTANVSEFSKKLDAWNEFRRLNFSLNDLSKDDTIGIEDAKSRVREDKLTNKVSGDLSYVEIVENVDAQSWKDIYDFLKNDYAKDSWELRTLLKFTRKSGGIANTKKIDDYPVVFKLLEEAKNKGFIIEKG
tara:strand:- start:4182 stop:6326 length:2145 start_codon:yes stop_codon:yes gene_type:complete